MNWNNSWLPPSYADPSIAGQQLINTSNPLDLLSQDELLVKHMSLKQAVEQAKEAEMELRKYIVNRAFPAKTEGVNTLELGNGYQLKAKVTFHYNLADNETVE